MSISIWKKSKKRQLSFEYLNWSERTHSVTHSERLHIEWVAGIVFISWSRWDRQQSLWPAVWQSLWDVQEGFYGRFRGCRLPSPQWLSFVDSVTAFECSFESSRVECIALKRGTWLSTVLEAALRTHMDLLIYTRFAVNLFSPNLVMSGKDIDIVIQIVNINIITIIAIITEPLETSVLQMQPLFKWPDEMSYFPKSQNNNQDNFSEIKTLSKRCPQFKSLSHRPNTIY